MRTARALHLYTYRIYIYDLRKELIHLEYPDKLPFAEVEANYLSVCERVRRASGGRCGVLLATKTVSCEQMNLLAGGHAPLLIGENRVQELCEKYPFLDRERMEIHFIGHLQTNKVKQIIDKVSMIHSVDSLRLAEEIDRRAAGIGKVMDVLCEINIGREADKGGAMPEEAEELCARISALPALRLRGLMTMAPRQACESDNAPFFKETKEIYERIRASSPTYTHFDTLSMGMSDSYGIAAALGATVVRVGSAVFGKRSPLVPDVTDK